MSCYLPVHASFSPDSNRSAEHRIILKNWDMERYVHAIVQLSVLSIRPGKRMFEGHASTRRTTTSRFAEEHTECARYRVQYRGLDPILACSSSIPESDLLSFTLILPDQNGCQAFIQPASPIFRADIALSYGVISLSNSLGY